MRKKDDMKVAAEQKIFRICQKKAYTNPKDLVLI